MLQFIQKFKKTQILAAYVAMFVACNAFAVTPVSPGPVNLASPGPIGGTTPNTGAFTSLSATLPFTHPLGTVLLPSITFTGDTNTGIYSSAADTFNVATNGVNRLQIGTNNILALSPTVFGSTLGVSLGGTSVLEKDGASQTSFRGISSNVTHGSSGTISLNAGSGQTIRLNTNAAGQIYFGAQVAAPPDARFIYTGNAVNAFHSSWLSDLGSEFLSLSPTGTFNGNDAQYRTNSSNSQAIYAGNGGIYGSRLQGSSSGSASSPTITVGSSSGKGFYDSGGIAFATSSSQVGLWDSGGLTLLGGGGQQYLRFNGSADQIRRASGGGFEISTNSAIRARINTTGDLLISTATAAASSQATVTGGIAMRSGSDVATKYPGGTMKVFTANVGNVGTGEDNLFSYLTDATTLEQDGESLDFEVTLNVASSATASRKIRILFDTMVLYDSGAITDAALQGNVNIRCSLTRSLTVPDGLRSVTTLTFSDTLVPSSIQRVAVNDTIHAVFDGYITQDNLLRITGEVAGVGAATDDIVARAGSIKWNAVGN